MVKRILFFITAVGFFSLSQANQPNFILFITDDISWDDLGCYGSKVAKTPHLDKMAKEGPIRTPSCHLIGFPLPKSLLNEIRIYSFVFWKFWRPDLVGNADCGIERLECFTGFPSSNLPTHAPKGIGGLI